MSRWDNDASLERDLSIALREGRDVSERSRAAARAVFAWRTVDAEMLTLTEAVSAPEVVMRASSPTRRRILASSDRQVSIDLELSAGTLCGQILPEHRGTVTLNSPHGAITVEADDDGFFSLGQVPTGTVWLEIVVGEARFKTEWFDPFCL